MATNSRKRFAKHALGGAAAIDVGRVEKIDPQVKRLVDASERLTLFNAARIGQPGAERNNRDLQFAGVKTRKCMNCPARVNELATQAASIESRRRSGRNEPPVG